VGNAIVKEDNDKAKRIGPVAAIVATGDYDILTLRGLPPNCSKIIWRMNGTVKSPSGIKYEAKADDMQMPEDLPTLQRDKDY
jgi:hypothetical protein